MEKPTILLCLLCFITAISTEITVAHSEGIDGAVRLFVFGDSYADTGNTIPGTACWKQPYGITFPGRPNGRFSDGHVFTDYIASFLGVKSPVAYNNRKTNSNLKDGMNFAYGGTGVFDTLISEPNMTTQIDFFRDLLSQQTGFSLDPSIALVSASGNDYVAFIQKNLFNILKLRSFSNSFIKQLGTDISRLQGLGVKKIAVTTMGPVGCLPAFSFLTMYSKCLDIVHLMSMYHNELLREMVRKMDNSSNIVILDLYSSFLTAFKAQNQTGNLTFEQLLRPCCEGMSLEDSCGSTDESGAKKYTLCKNPEQAFFWDNEHPTQNGWSAIFSALKPSLGKLIS